MGRVASKRKLKQCDPFYKGKQSVKAKHNDKYDLAPKNGLSKRKRKRLNRSIDEKRLEREVLGLNIPTVKTMKVEFEGRKQGESFKQFSRRLGHQTKQALMEETKRGLKSTEKRNKFFAEKKAKKKRAKMTEQERYEHDYKTKGEERPLDFGGSEAVTFGDRYDAPPELPKLKGVSSKSSVKSLLLTKDRQSRRSRSNNP